MNQPSHRPRESLESQLGIILHGLGIAAVDLADRTERLASKRHAEERRADEHRRAKAQLRKLDEDAEEWSRAESLLRLIAQVEPGSSRNHLRKLPTQTDGSRGQERSQATLILPRKV